MNNLSPLLSESKKGCLINYLYDFSHIGFLFKFQLIILLILSNSINIYMKGKADYLYYRFFSRLSGLILIFL
jgi:hypothetical protein